MKYQCSNPDCKEIFIYAAKLIQQDLHAKQDFPKDYSYYAEKIIETHVCPFCESLDFEEYIEPKTIEKISSVKSVELEKVDEWITQGYEVKELYAKMATMIKKEKIER